VEFNLHNVPLVLKILLSQNHFDKKTCTYEKCLSKIHLPSEMKFNQKQYMMCAVVSCSIFLLPYLKKPLHELQMYVPFFFHYLLVGT
jgi:hypothetical protein